MHDKRALIEVVRRWADALDKGDTAAAFSLLADDVLIVDDVPPFRWSGFRGAEEWLRLVTGTRERLNAGFSLAEPDKVEADQNHAYLVFRGRLTISSGGNTHDIPGLVTFTLRRVESEWLIDTIVWSDRD